MTNDTQVTIEPQVTIDVEDGVAELRLNRPDARNAWTSTLAAQLRDAVDRCDRDPEIRAVLLIGEGKVFCAGQDLSSGFGAQAGFRERPDGTPDLRGILVEHYAPVIRAIRTSRKPYVAGVQGAAVGIGASLAWACDQVVVGRSAVFVVGFARVGLILDGGASAFLAARAGLGRATRAAMLAEPIGSEQALDWGLADEVVDDGDVEAAAAALAERLAGGPTLALGRIKQQLNAALLPALDAQLALEADLQQELAATADFREGVAAFGERRDPAFSGR
jgi:2-(1,2-epoxy-1,2-dihydrophenyl)acetyl-CoA isomerase